MGSGGGGVQVYQDFQDAAIVVRWLTQQCEVMLCFVKQEQPETQGRGWAGINVSAIKLRPTTQILSSYFHWFSKRDIEQQFTIMEAFHLPTSNSGMGYQNASEDSTQQKRKEKQKKEH